MMRAVILIALAVVVRAGAARAQAKPLQGLDAYVTRSMAAWKIPGLAIAVVRNDSVVLAKGYGVRTVGKPDPVKPSTLFAIGSSTKAFTALAVAMLVDQGKLGWDDRVTERLPGFQMYDPYVTRELTVRDLLTHRSGLIASDLLVFKPGVSRDSILHQVRYVKPTYSFRSHYGYQNLMFLAAGQITARLSGPTRTWDDVIRERILMPLGMRHSNTSITALEGQADVATPHAVIDDTLRAIPYFNLDPIAPAGSINSNVLDMAQWVRFQLAGGKVGGKPLLGPAAFTETRTPQTIVPLEGYWKNVVRDAHLYNYGMGWYLHDYHGRLIVQHGGNIDGMTALVALLPEERTGLVILSNLDGNDLTYALMYRVFDAYLGRPPKDWSGIMLKASTEQSEQGEKEKKAKAAKRIAGTSPALPLEKYAGTYTDTLLGDAVVRKDGKGLVFQFGRLVLDLEHWQYETFRGVFRDRRLGEMDVTFTIDAEGNADELKSDLASFRRKPEPKPALNPEPAQ